MVLGKNCILGFVTAASHADEGKGDKMKFTKSLIAALFIVSVFSLIVTAGASAQTAEDFWAMKTGNSWTYSGSSNLGFTWTWRSEVVGTDGLVTLPGYTTYHVQEFDNGFPDEENWYAINTSEIRQLQIRFSDDVIGLVTVRVPEGLLMGKNPIVVGESWFDNPVSATFNGVPVALAAQNSVIGQGPVTDGSGRTHTAYQVRRILSATIPGEGQITETVTKWFVPYFGVVKEETTASDIPGEIETEILASANITLPAGTSFVDVPATYFAHSFIEQLRASGITGGCSAVQPPMFCPENAVTRGQMAVFVESFLGNPPNTCQGQFSDVPTTNGFCGFIERMAQDGITSGCGGNNFCPDSPVTRGQMAVFIEVALGNPANTCLGQFNDVPSTNGFCGFIERMAQDGITSGCGNNNFCPDNPVTRAQMAVFLMTAAP
jgi:hypothetical protein